MSNEMRDDTVRNTEMIRARIAKLFGVLPSMVRVVVRDSWSEETTVEIEVRLG